ncbi:hypothetical protein BJ875DRAFT_512023 [Amylocarpus encephaloides]|uniref:Uncharacterized protein n=1 Tax=Amylocarpus encephaloides TaxID=45428 RepID=A0A9P8C4H2_9HELO|nr:hypothetical protein BJ875DRAFT_512023 [Amylocarpus encephaloides]
MVLLYEDTEYLSEANWPSRCSETLCGRTGLKQTGAGPRQLKNSGRLRVVQIKLRVLAIMFTSPLKFTREIECFVSQSRFGFVVGPINVGMAPSGSRRLYCHLKGRARRGVSRISTNPAPDPKQAKVRLDLRTLLRLTTPWGSDEKEDDQLGEEDPSVADTTIHEANVLKRRDILEPQLRDSTEATTLWGAPGLRTSCYDLICGYRFELLLWNHHQHQKMGLTYRTRDVRCNYASLLWLYFG